MQLRLRIALATLASLLWSDVAAAEDRVDFTTTWYQERRRGPLGGLSVVHPQLDLEADVGEATAIGVNYAADVVTGATAAVYSTDAVSSATRFEDTRHDGTLSLGFTGSRSTLTIAGGAATERDYHSISISVGGSVDMPGKNTNLALSYTHNFDEVCDKDNAMATPLERRALVGIDECRTRSGIIGKNIIGTTVWQDLSIDTAQATLTQNLSPTLVGQLSAFGQVLRGFQENPYRRVAVAGVEAQESLPNVRARLALTARANRYIEALKSAVGGSVRGYSDTWGVNSVTLGMRYSQYAGSHLLLEFRGRVHQQSEATFFKDAFFYETEGPAGEYFTGDRELGAIRNVVTGARLSYLAFDDEGGEVWAVFDELDFHLKGDLFFFDELPADPIEDNREGIDRQFLSSDQLLDAFVIQLGLRLRY